MWIQYDWLNKFYIFYMAAVVGISLVVVVLELKSVIETNQSELRSAA